MKTLEERIADAIDAWAEDWNMDLEGENAAIYVLTTLHEFLTIWESKTEEDE